MKTIIHLTLSDSDRSDLAKRIYRDPNTKVLVTRKEVTETVLALIQQEIEDGRDQEEEGSVRRAEQEEKEVQPDVQPGFVASRGDEDYLAQPKDAGVAAACSRILDDTALIEAFAWDTVERNRSK